MLFAGYLIRLRVDRTLVDPRFIHHYLRTAETRTLVERLAKSTSGVNNINGTQIKGLPLLRPGVHEQHEIVRRIDAAFAWIDRLANEASNARKLIGHLDQAILAKAFQGELVPQDPHDEPASVLLELIRARANISCNSVTSQTEATDQCPHLIARRTSQCQFVPRGDVGENSAAYGAQ